MKRGLSRGLIFFALILIILPVFVSAAAQQQNCVTQSSRANQRMLRVSAETNSHLSEWNINDYGLGLCFDDYFAQSYSGAGNIRACNTNGVINLSASTNAHAEMPGGKNYSVPVCFGDLKCIVIPSTSSCPAQNIPGYRTPSYLLSLSGITNAHVSLIKNTAVYPYTLCCASVSENPICVRDGNCIPPETPYNCPDDCPLNAVCGNGVIDSGEECDGSNLNGKSCTTQGFSSGSLSCYPSGNANECTFNTAGCTGGSGGICETYAPGEIMSFTPPGGTSAEVARCEDYNYADDVPSSDVDEVCRLDCTGAADKQANVMFSSAPASFTYSDVRCKWNGTWCAFAYNSSSIGGGNIGDIVECVWDYDTPATCSEGQSFVTVSYTARSLSGTGVCDAGCGQATCTRNIPCPKVIKLPFFSTINFVLAALVLIAGYFVIFKKK